MHRRTFILSGLVSAVASQTLAQNASAIKMDVFKSATCGCCAAWVDHVRAAGFDVTVHDLEQDQLWAIKNELQITPELAGCHTAVVDGYFLEGHVHNDEIARLLSERPSGRGLSVPGMPMGSPGMDFSDARDVYETLLIGPDGTTSVFAAHS